MKTENRRLIIILVITLTALAIVAVVPVKTEVEPAAERTVKLYDIPLNADLQVYIKNLAEDRDISETLIMAVIGKESNYFEHAIGDNGNAFGLMQVWPSEHDKRMKKLGVEDLLEPYGNILVGVDYLDELLDQHRGVEWALTAYNAGIGQADYESAIGISNDYAETVLKIQEDIEQNI